MRNSYGLPALALASTILLQACGGSSSSSSNPVSGNEPGGDPVALCEGEGVSPERLFLQQLGSDRVIIKWRSNALGLGDVTVLCFGEDPQALPASSLSTAEITETRHSEVLLTGLKPDTRYYYSVGGAATAEPGHWFRTAPVTGQVPSDGNTRIWVLGDAGTSSSAVLDQGDNAGGQAAVRDGYHKWRAENGGEETDLLLMLGDNAYLDGTDAQFQTAVFDMYAQSLSKVAMWSTIGNHEMGSSGTSTAVTTQLYLPATGLPDLPPNAVMPYLNIYSFPTGGEVGGVASGTEQYYSFDYGNVHVVSLDSQVAARDADNKAAMREWLEADLLSNTLDWTIVIFHHPPYTKGSHDSDSTAAGVDQPIFTMREEFNQIFEDHRVDLVYGGHSHSYERSYYLRGHYGLSDSYSHADHAEVNSVGEPLTGQQGQEYQQITASGADDRVVYTVAGSAGQASGMTGRHPAHVYSESLLGSVVVDAGKDRLVARFIDVNGEALDYFTITK